MVNKTALLDFVRTHEIKKGDVVESVAVLGTVNFDEGHVGVGNQRLWAKLLEKAPTAAEALAGQPDSFKIEEVLCG